MPELTGAGIAAACGGELIGRADASVAGIGADSRTIPERWGFAAVGGGHAFVSAALERGASLAIVERRDALPPGATGIVVESVERALLALAARWRTTLGVRAVGVTGSTGKTLTKDLLAAALRSRFRVHAAPESYNNEVGLPLTVLSCPPDAEVLVAELAARRPGEIAELCAAVRPEVGIVTGIGVTHLEIFGSRDAIAKTKAELVSSLPPTGLAVLPAGDDFLSLLASSTPARVLTVGAGGAVRSACVTVGDDGRAAATLEPWGVRVRVPVPGRALVHNAAMAVAAAAAMGADPGDAASAISGARVSRWRMEVVRSGGRTIVNDAYNSNPVSAASALHTAAEMAKGRPLWAVLGRMAELGPIAHREHVRIGRLAAALGFDRVVVVGAEASGIAEGAGDIAVQVDDPPRAAALVGREAPRDAVVLVKASRAAGLEEAACLLVGARA